MATKAEKLEALAKKQAQIQKQIQAIKARETAQDRKDDTRRKVLVGGFVMAQLKKAKKEPTDISFAGVSFSEMLKADRDRVLFGLPPLPAAPVAPSPTGEAGGGGPNA